MNLQEPATFSRVYAQHAREVEAIARRILGDRAQAEDVTHDVFLRLWSRPQAYDPARADVGAYLRVLARSRAADAQRSRGAAARATERLRAAVPPAAQPATGDGPAQRSERSDERRRLGRALGTLPMQQREALVLSYWGDLPDHQVARRSGVPLGTAKSRIRLGLGRMRAAYGERELA
ncbi:MAG TPA: sigma-70 family RNA polymerase sigma factor [Solirubrobacteraceae bacterium]|jgi:RNA polymerase sigma-70 factor (ECF subfamily)|nr:sigma-70 family RNA polymerase sigma factor [Solirubrobacteraceae bacterium]